MTETTGALVAELAGNVDRALQAVGPVPGACLGFLVTPGEVVARMVSANTGDAGREAMRGEVDRLGGMPALVRAALAVEAWMEDSLGWVALGGAGTRPRAEWTDHPLFGRFSLEGGRIRIDKLPTRRAVAHLSGETPGLHDQAPEPTGRWRRRLAETLAPLMAGLPAITENDIAVEELGYVRTVTLPGTHRLLAERWGVHGMGSLEHLPDVLIRGAALRIALVMNRVHRDADGLSEVVARGEAGLKAKLEAEMGETPGAAITVDGTRIHRSHVRTVNGALTVGHHNATTRITLPGHTLRPETVTTGVNISTKMEFNDVRRYELGLRERGPAMRAGGITVSPLLERLMRRDGVDRETMISAMRGEEALVPTAEARGMGFATDVSKVEARNGHVDCHLRLGRGVVYRRGRIHAMRTEIPDTVRENLKDGPLSKLVEHEMLANAVVTTVTAARTGSLIVGVRLN